MANELEFHLHGSSVNIVRKCRDALSDILNTKFGCVATFDGVDFESESRIAQQQQAAVVPEKRLSVALHGGVQLSVWKADLTSFDAEAVVNAANTGLQHSGGLAQALSTVGGPEIQQESSDYIQKYGYLETGDAVVLGAGSLKCRKIIHAVGPHVSKPPKNHEMVEAKRLLEKVIYSTLDKVAKHHLSTVAIPAISSGLFNYPLPKCADTIVAAVKNYYEHTPSVRYFPKEIFLVNNDEPTVKEMLRACLETFSSSPPMLYSQVTGRNTWSAAKTSEVTLQVGNVLLTLKKDRIEEQKTDVIVNTASPDRDLSLGQISGAILKKAGHEMQREIRNAFEKNHIIITDSYRLNCKKVYHTFCKRKEKDPTQHKKAHQVFLNAVLSCLWTAAHSQYKSIAFPAIGTGHLGFSKQEAASIMLKAVIDFAQRFPETLNVYFVIFPDDHSTFQAFEKQIRSFKEEMMQSSFKSGFESRNEFQSKSITMPKISLSGPTNESVKEAEKWLEDTLFNSSSDVSICNNFILHFGKQEHQRLSRLTKAGVSIEEFLTQGHACIKVEGHSKEETVSAALKVEKMLCDIQKEFVSEEERELHALSTMSISFKRREIDHSGYEFSSLLSAFKSQDLWVLKMEKVENPALTSLFDLKKNQLKCSSTPETMFQCIPAQFCEMISRIGFHTQCAPPEEPLFGDGIYFASTIKKAMEVWKEKKGKYLYFVKADVLTGKSTRGKPGFILPPHMGTDPHVRYDSVRGPDVAVIFSGYQALPKYIITCIRK